MILETLRRRSGGQLQPVLALMHFLGNVTHKKPPTSGSGRNGMRVLLY